MWRLNSYWRFQQSGDGVIVEVESLTLSRNLPPIIGVLIRPIVTGTARESITRTLASMRAVCGMTACGLRLGAWGLGLGAWEEDYSTKLSA